jgi:hypothetical protein
MNILTQMSKYNSHNNNRSRYNEERGLRKLAQSEKDLNRLVSDLDANGHHPSSDDEKRA